MNNKPVFSVSRGSRKDLKIPVFNEKGDKVGNYDLYKDEEVSRLMLVKRWESVD